MICRRRDERIGCESSQYLGAITGVVNEVLDSVLAIGFDRGEFFECFRTMKDLAKQTQPQIRWWNLLVLVPFLVLIAKHVRNHRVMAL